MNNLTVKEALDFDRLEKTVARHWDAFIEAGLALTEICDRRLYRRDFPDFNTYCEKRWGCSRQHAHRLIQAAAVVQGLRKDLSPQGDTIKTERMARELVKIPQPKRAEIVAKAAANGPLTVKSLHQAANPTIEMDATGWPIPSTLIELWNRSDEVDAVLHYLSKLKSALSAAQEKGDPLWSEVNFSTVLGDLEKAWTAIQCAKPYAVCTQCQGHPEIQPKGQCPLCRGRGLISRFRWERLVPEEIKKVRGKGAKK